MTASENLAGCMDDPPAAFELWNRANYWVLNFAQAVCYFFPYFAAIKLGGYAPTMLQFVPTSSSANYNTRAAWVFRSRYLPSRPARTTSSRVWVTGCCETRPPRPGMTTLCGFRSCCHSSFFGSCKRSTCGIHNLQGRRTRIVVRALEDDGNGQREEICREKAQSPSWSWISAGRLVSDSFIELPGAS